MATEKEIEKEVKNEIAKSEKLFHNILKNPWMVSTIVLVIVLIIILSYGSLRTGSIGKTGAADVLTGFAATSGVDIKINNITDEGSFYQIAISTPNGDGPVYMTKDGKYLVQGIIPLTANAVQDTNTQTTQEEIPKSDKPKVELYIMSFCPYGNEAEKTMQPVYNLLKNKIDFNVHFIASVSGSSVSSLHGQKEVDQDEREACVLNESGTDKWMIFANYVNNNCGSNGSCWEAAAKSASLDVNKIKSCVSSKGLNLMKSEEAAANAAGASGSPTLIINGVESSAVYQYGDSEAYKQAICSAFNTAPAECSQALTSSSSSTPAGSCG